MRTTLTIDDQLAAALKREAFESGRSFKAVVNDVIARGLEAPASAKKSSRRYRIKPTPLGKPMVDLTHATRLAAELEDQEITRKIELRK